jgi:hypothetical protein
MGKGLVAREKANALPNPNSSQGSRKSLIIRPIAIRRRNAHGPHWDAGLNLEVNPVTKRFEQKRAVSLGKQLLVFARQLRVRGVLAANLALQFIERGLLQAGGLIEFRLSFLAAAHGE